MYLLILYLLSIVPSLLAYPSGAPAQACSDLMPQHGAEPREGADGIYVLRGDVFDGPYIPGRTYQIQLTSSFGDFAGFFIQARAESNQDSVSSIVGVWEPLNGEAKIAQCNGVNGDSITHSSRSPKTEQTFNWTAPSTNVGRIHFLYSIVVSYSNIIVKVNATEQRLSDTIAPPPEPPLDAVFPNSYGQPEGCQRQNCVFYVEWRNNENFIDFRMEGNGDGWIALGVTAQNLPLNTANRNFSDILLCQAEPNGDTANVKDLFLEGGSLMPANDTNINGTEYRSGNSSTGVGGGRIFCKFSRVVFVLDGQEGQDASFLEDNYLFFLSGSEQGNSAAIPTDFSTSAPNAVFSNTPINLVQGSAVFSGTFSDLPGRGSFPTSSCSREDCDFYFRWGVNPDNPNYLTFFISADLSRGWAAIGVSTDRRMGGDEIDDIFGCTTTDGGPPIAADTFNIAGGDRSNVGDSSVGLGIILHSSGVVDGRMECTFSRTISVIQGDENSDFNLDNSYYIMIGTGGQQGAPFQRHERNPEVSTSKVNLVRDTSVNFDYARIPLIKTHGIFMILSWPILAYLGITMARHMKPAMPNGGWFQVHRILVLTSLFFTCLAFILIFVAFRNNDTSGLINLGDTNRLGTAHFALGIIVVALQFANPIIALFRCKPGSENRWIFNTFHGFIIGLTLQLVSIANVLIGLFLFGDKIANPEDMSAYWVMVALVSAFGLVDGTMSFYFGLLSQKMCADKTKPREGGNDDVTQMKRIGSSDSDDSPPPQPTKKKPSQDHWLRWAGWVTLAVIAVSLGITTIGLVGSG